MTPEPAAVKGSPVARNAGRHTKQPEQEINEFAVRIATMNGSGSASVNGLLVKAIFRMGVPVSGKNIFPSNIQGLPAWFEIRASSANHTGRTSRQSLLIAMNTQTFDTDIRALDPGGYVLYDSAWSRTAEPGRHDVNFLGIPLTEMCADHFAESRQRVLMKNIGYAGAVVALLSLDLSMVSQLLDETFGAEERVHQANQTALQLGYE
jgi:2-oxoglutarate ferredoxin oxidoreductase subunit alpha